MSDDKAFFVAYPGELTASDETALDRDEFTVYRNRIGVGDPAIERDTPATENDTLYTVVRVAADTPDEALRQVIVALGREPAGLQVESGR